MSGWICLGFVGLAYGLGFWTGAAINLSAPAARLHAKARDEYEARLKDVNEGAKRILMALKRARLGA